MREARVPAIAHARRQLADRQPQRAPSDCRERLCPSHARSSPNGATCPCRSSQGTRLLVYKAIEQMNRALEPGAHGRPALHVVSAARALRAMRFPHDASFRWRPQARHSRRSRRCACTRVPAENRERGSRAAHARRPASVGPPTRPVVGVPLMTLGVRVRCHSRALL